MGQHNIPRGEKSSMGGSNGSPGTPGYEGKHRQGDKIDGHSLSNPNRVTERNNNYDRNA